jgi:hypothetical protein
MIFKGVREKMGKWPPATNRLITDDMCTPHQEENIVKIIMTQRKEDFGRPKMSYMQLEGCGHLPSWHVHYKHRQFFLLKYQIGLIQVDNNNIYIYIYIYIYKVYVYKLLKFCFKGQLNHFIVH